MKRVVKIGDFKIDEEDKKAVLEVLDSGKMTEGPKTMEFEVKWAKTIGTNYAVAVNSGTSALISCLLALKIISGNSKKTKVITTPLTYIADSNAIKIAGLEPVYVDVDRKTFSIAPEEIVKKLDEINPEEVLAILPVHLMGYPCDMNTIMRIARKNKIYVIEDSAQAHGTKYYGQKTGSFGDVSIFSFYIAHNIQVGEFGVINTNDLKIKKILKQIKANGRRCSCEICIRTTGKCPELLKDPDSDPRFTHDFVGLNCKTMDLISALALHRVDKIDEINQVRRKNVLYLNERLKEFENELQLPLYSEDVSYLGYPIVLKNGNRSKITKELEERGIETRPIFGCIPLQQPAFSYLKMQYLGKLPNAEYVGENGFYIGCHQYLEKEDLDYIFECFCEILGNKINNYN